MKTILTVLILLLCNINANAQVSLEWDVTHNGSANLNDEGKSIVYDGQGNVVVTGNVISTGINYDIATVKYNSAGVRQWAVVFNGPGNDADYAVDIATDNAANIYVAGKSRNNGDYDMLLIKYNSAGVQQWAVTWNSPSGLTDEGYSVIVDNNQNAYITGYAEISGFNTNYVTVKYNSSGVLQWARQYDGPIANSPDAAFFVESDQSGNVYVTGTSTAPGTGSDFLTIKYNPQGDSVWVRRFAGPGNSHNEIPQGLDVDQSGNVYITGFYSGPQSIDYMTIKYNTSGTQQWAIAYDSTHGQDIPEDITVDPNGNVFVTGRSRINSTYNDFCTIKYNSSGVRQWLRVYDNLTESRDDIGLDVEADAQGNVYVTGITNEDGSNYSIITIKYDAGGVQKWLAEYDETDDDECYQMVLDQSNNVYVIGFKDDVNADFLTLKYSQTIGINQIATEIPDGFSLHQNYPNPFNPVTKIRFDVPSSSHFSNVRLTVFDAAGRKVEELVNQILAAGSYEADFNAGNRSSGVYFYELAAGDFTETKKMVVLK